MQSSDITVVLPTLNEEKNIAYFLASLPDRCRLIVVDAGDDRTAEIVARHRSPEFTQIVRLKSTISEARQIGMELAGTGWVLFTDADVVFPPTYFRALAGYAEFDCIYGPKLSHNRFRRYYRWFAHGQWISHKMGIPAASGSNLLVRRHIVTEVGGFDPDLLCNEDSELVWRIKRAGYRTAFALDLPVYAMDHRRLERGVFRKTLHSVVRCLFLYCDLIPARWRRLDWGYWSHVQQGESGASAQD